MKTEIDHGNYARDDTTNTIEMLENRVHVMEDEIKQLKAEKRELAMYVKGFERELENVIEYLNARHHGNC